MFRLIIYDEIFMNHYYQHYNFQSIRSTFEKNSKLMVHNIYIYD